MSFPTDADVDDAMSFIRDARLAFVHPHFRMEAHLREAALKDFEREGRDLDRQAPMPSRSTSFDSSAMTMKRAACCSTIFSRSSAPPRPLIRRSCGSISSAPSIARSSGARSASIASGMSSDRADPRSAATYMCSAPRAPAATRRAGGRILPPCCRCRGRASFRRALLRGRCALLRS